MDSSTLTARPSINQSTFHFFIFGVLILLIRLSLCQSAKRDVSWVCPNDCSGHGFCSSNTNGYCVCYQGYVGVDCSLRTCPSNKAWVDIPMQDNIAHRDFTECSNMGTCNRQTGLCSCREGFTGPACDILACPTGNKAEATFTYSADVAVCSGNGRCMSLRQLSVYTDYVNYFDNPKSEYSDWDADRIHGCVCNSGWTGPACDLMTCPLGDDPSTEGLDEVQLLDCLCKTCTGGVYLTLHGEQTPLIPYDAPAALIEYYLENFLSVDAAEVNFQRGSQLCSTTGSVTRITLQLPVRQWGTLGMTKTPTLIVDSRLFGVRAKGAFSRIYTPAISSTRTKEVVECSNRGTCDRQTGSCACFSGYSSSDGLGNAGQSGDCGLLTSFQSSYIVNGVTLFSPCPVANGQVCAGNGFCDVTTGVCSCNVGFGGANCSLILCPVATAWFGLVEQGHTLTSECAGIGYCDYSTGQCSNCGGNSLRKVFGGSACQLLTCPSDKAVTCGGNGACLSLRQLADFAWNERKELLSVTYSTPWDADMIQGCACDRALSVDNQFYLDYSRVIGDSSFNESSLNYTLHYSDEYINKFYRGPFAFAATDFRGYNCAKKACPTGDSPLNLHGVNEIQSFYCVSDGNATFTLTFRQNTTRPIHANATLSEVQTKLQELFTIGEVNVYKASDYAGERICSNQGNFTVFVEFLTEYGQLPMLSFQPLSGDVELYIYREQRCTKFDLECSATGICDEDTGRCRCMKGFQSSNGSLVSPGQRGDCSYFNNFYTLDSQSQHNKTPSRQGIHRGSLNGEL